MCFTKIYNIILLRFSHSSGGSTKAVSGCCFLFMSIFTSSARCAVVGSITLYLKSMCPAIILFGKQFFRIIGGLDIKTDIVHLGVGMVELVLAVGNLGYQLFIERWKGGNSSSVQCSSQSEIGKG